MYAGEAATGGGFGLAESSVERYRHYSSEDLMATYAQCEALGRAAHAQALACLAIIDEREAEGLAAMAWET